MSPRSLLYVIRWAYHQLYSNTQRDQHHAALSFRASCCCCRLSSVLTLTPEASCRCPSWQVQSFPSWDLPHISYAVYFAVTCCVLRHNTPLHRSLYFCTPFQLPFRYEIHETKQMPSSWHTQAHATQKSNSALPSCVVLSLIAASSTCCVLMQVLTSGRLAFVTRWVFT